MSAAQKLEKGKMRVRILKAKKPDEGKIDSTQGLSGDPFAGMYNQDILLPPYDLLTLSSLWEKNQELRPVIDAMTVNIEEQGHKIVPKVSVADNEGKVSSIVQREIDIVLDFFENCILDLEDVSFLEFRSRLRFDLESTGNNYMEIIPYINFPNVPAGFKHLPSWTMRICRKDKEFTEYEVPRSVRNPSTGLYQIHRFVTSKRFRRYVQIDEYTNEKIYFKEWGDPRNISKRTGEVISRPTNLSELAHSIIHRKLYCPRSPYGLPRTIGNLFGIYGSRAAEEINYMTLDNNQIPALALLANNVEITDGSVDRIEEFLEERVSGDKNYATIVLIESVPAGEGGLRDPSSMSLKFEDLTRAQREDGMFSDYMKNMNDAIRKSFRVPPIFVGGADEYNRATAEASRKLAEEQIFRSERLKFDTIMNLTVLTALETPNVQFKSNVPNVSDNYELTQLLAVGESTGGLTPARTQVIVEDVFGQELPSMSDDVPKDVPYSLTRIREEAKAKAQAQGFIQSDDQDVAKVVKTLIDLAEDSEGEVPEEVQKNLGSLLRLIRKATIPSVSDEIQENTIKKVEKTIVQENGQYCVYSEDGKTNFGCYDTKEEAEERLHQIEQFKGFVKKNIPIFKLLEAEEQIVGGIVLMPDEVDLVGDIYDGETVRKAAHYFMLHYLEDNDHGIRLHHKGETIPEKVKVIQSYVTPIDMEVPVELFAAYEDHPSLEFHDDTLVIPKNTWILFGYILDIDIWEMVKSGEITGWSMGGIATVQELKSLLVA